LPLYEYKCGKCGHRFEKIESMSASVTKKCPKCGAKAERMFAAPAIQFKGSGWYVTDYAGKGSSKSEGESTSSGNSGADKSGKSEKSESKSSDSKAGDAKSESKSKESSSSKSEKSSKKEK
jgi:putative FmdB family regulatory protein